MEKETNKLEPYYQRLAKEVVDNLFDSKTFNEKMTRDDLQCVEDYFGWYLQMVAYNSKRITKISERFKSK